MADAPTPEDVADLLEVVAQANGRLRAEVDGLNASRAAVSHITITRLQWLADDLRPGATARAELAELAALDTKLLLAGMTTWVRRRRTQLHGTTNQALQRQGGADT